MSKNRKYMMYGTILLLGILKEMGLAASQARLLSLTSRQHTVEHRAQFLQAQKLRLANDSDAVYEKYINALDSTKLETRTYDSKGTVHWVDGSLSNLLRYSADDKAAGNIYYVQNIKDGKLYMPRNITTAYENSGGDLYNFLNTMNVQYHNAYDESYLNAKAKVDTDIANGWHLKPWDGRRDQAVLIETYNKLLAKTHIPDLPDTYYAAQRIYNMVYNSQNITKTTYLPWKTSQLQDLKNDLSYLKNSSGYSSDPVVRALAEYCINFDISGIFSNPDAVTTLNASTSDTKEYYIYYDKSKEDAKEDPNARQSVNEIFKLRMLLNGGTYKLNGGTAQDVYDTTIKNQITSFTGSEQTNMGDALINLCNNIMNSEYSKAVQQAEENLEGFVVSTGTNTTTISAAFEHYQQYCQDEIELSLQSSATHKEYEDSILGKYYENMFNAISQAGGCIALADENVKSSSWVNNMIKNAQVVLAVYNNEREEIDNVTASSNPGIREVSNDEEIVKIDLEYETALEAITSKETKYNTQLNQLEAERSAIQTEMESLKKVAKENIESTFKLFS